MKLNRLHIDRFAVDDYPTLNRDNLNGENLVLIGGNRSGKTLTVNALLYGLFGPRATLGVKPGRKSQVEMHFDNGHVLQRSGSGRKYIDGDEHRKEGADDRIREVIGSEDLISLQFVHSETNRLPLARLSGEELLTHIRRLGGNSVQDKLDTLTNERERLEIEIEQVERTEFRPIERDLAEIDVHRHENRLEKIEQLQSLIDTGRIKTIKQRLLDNQEINDQLDDLYHRRRTIEQTLRKKERQLREERRYTQSVNDIIIEAIDEFTCPVCDHVVEEELARRRLQNSQCPHCARDRSLDDLKSNLRAKVDGSGEAIDTLEQEIEELDSEREKIDEEITALQESVPDLSDLNNLTKHTLKDKEYDIEAVAEETEKRLAQHRDEVDNLKEKKQSLKHERDQIEAELTDLRDSIDTVEKEITALHEQSFEEGIADFEERWSECYQEIADDLGQEIRIGHQGTVQLPGNEGARDYSQLSTGETRLLNLAFAYTVATTEKAVEDNFDVIVLDEPFANLESDKRERAITFIQDVNVQFLVMTSNEAIRDMFDPALIASLQRMTIQLTWEDWEDPS